MSDSDSFFAAAYGSHERFQSVMDSLSTPPSYSSLRINYQLAPASTSANNTNPPTPTPLQLLAEHMQPINARLHRQNRLPYTMHWHPILPQCLIIPSAPPPTSSTTGPNSTTPAPTNHPSVVIVDQRCGESVLLGADIFAKGILSCSRPLSIHSSVGIYAVSKSRKPRGSKPQEFFEAIAAHPGDIILEIGRGIMVQDRHNIFQNDAGVAVQVLSRNNIADAPPLNALLKQLNASSSFTYFAQTIPSMVASVALNPKPHDMVLDMCASPGGKTTHLASLMQGQGIVIAFDKTKSKVLKIKKLANQMGYSKIIYPLIGNSTMIVDSEAASVVTLIAEIDALEQTNGVEDHGVVVRVVARKNKKGSGGHGHGGGGGSNKKRQKTSGKPVAAGASASKTSSNLASTTSTTSTTTTNTTTNNNTTVLNTTMGLSPESFNKILLDPPCSALGQRPRLISTSKTTLHTLAQCADYQMALMRTAIALLKIGGSLVYSTCTHNPCENEIIVGQTLQEFPNMTLVGLPNGLDQMGAPGLPQHQIQKALDFMNLKKGASRDESIDRVLSWKVSGLSDSNNIKVRRFDPDGTEDSIGFFVAKFIKTS